MTPDNTQPGTGSHGSDRHGDGIEYKGPYCGVCQYPLEGLTESSKCPECGGALVEVLRWPAAPGPATGKRWRSAATHHGKPLIDVAFGPGLDGPTGKARGFIALGDDAKGFVAVGGSARGVVAVGGGAAGVFAFGGGAAGVVLAVGGGAAGGVFAVGGGAISFGGMAAGGGFGLLASVSGMGLASPVGLPVWETLAATGGAAVVALVGTLLYAGGVVMTKMRGGGNPYRRESAGS